MPFSFSITWNIKGDSPVAIETDEMKIVIGVIGTDRGSRAFHFGQNCSVLKPHVLEALKVYVKEQVDLLKLTQRMLA